MMPGIAQASLPTQVVENCFAFVVDNLPEISAVYGDHVAARVLHAVCRRTESMLPDTLGSRTIEPWGLLIQTWGWDADIDLAKVIPVLTLVCERPIEIDEIKISIALSTYKFDDLPCLATRRKTPFRISPDQYRADMKVAAAVYDAIDNRRLELLEQPIANVREGAEGLYSECLARAFDHDGQLISPGVFLPALERLRLTRAFDRYVMNATIDRLRMRPESRLGCNVSALSAVDDIWWTSICEELGREPAIAARLVIEITESALPEDWSRTKGFIIAMQRLGCRIALDDFGTGFSSIDFARSAGVDIIKVDGSFIRAATESERQGALLRHLVLLAGDLAVRVVVEGIETGPMLKIAQETGAGWLQGYLIGRPEKMHSERSPTPA